MKKTVSKFLLTGDNFMPGMHLRQPGFTYSACGPFTKNKERIQKFKETRDSSYLKKLETACFQHEWLMEILKIYLEKQLRIKCYVINYLILLMIRDMMNINLDTL